MATAEERAAAAGKLVALLEKGAFAEATKGFDERLKAALPPGELEREWRRLEAGTGRFKGTVDFVHSRTRDMEVVSARLEFGYGLINARVVFDSAGRISGLFFAPATPLASYMPPDYADLAIFREVDITFGEREWPLPGTLTLPVGASPSPGVVFVHGSGPMDRDETVGAVKVFRDLAYGLATKGIASLRYDKRTHEYAAQMFGMQREITIDAETVNDAIAAAETLRGVQDVDGGKVFMLGHSLGGMLLPRIARRDDGSAGFVLMGASTRRIGEVILDQLRQATEGDGEMPDAGRAFVEDMRRRVERMESRDLTEDTPASELPLNISARYWLDIRDYEPAAAAREVGRPMLVLSGGRDAQVPPEDSRRWEEALAGRENVTLKSYPSLDHLFVAGEGRSTAGERSHSGHVAREVVDDIAEWISTTISAMVTR